LEKTTAPDYPAAITGWRFWKLRRTRDGLAWLQSLMMDDLWPTREKFWAEKIVTEQNGEALTFPLSYSMNGIYAYKTSEYSLEYQHRFWYRGTLLGSVLLWGIVQQHELGYRAQFAYPSSLLFGICCDCMKKINLVREQFAIAWTSLHITERFSVNGFLCSRCNNRYYALDVKTCRIELEELAKRYGISIGKT
jgi:hypothetical protein